MSPTKAPSPLASRAKLASWLSIPGISHPIPFHLTAHVLPFLFTPPPYKYPPLPSSPLCPRLVFIATLPGTANLSTVHLLRESFFEVLKQKMNSLDSTFEALALHYVGFGLFTVVSNIWTLVAVVTAALSFWRFRVASLVPVSANLRGGSSPKSESSSNAIDSPSESSIREVTEGTMAVPAPPPAAALAPKTTKAPPTCGVGVTKGKFVTCYREDDQRVGEVAAAMAMNEEMEDTEESCERSDGEWWESWEKALKIRSNGGEKGAGWYDYQDLEVLNGSVVRLWEGRRRRKGMYMSSSPLLSSSIYNVVW